MLDLTHEQPARRPQQALRPLPFARLTSALGKALALSYRLTGKDRYDDFRLERVHGVPLLVTPSVFNPKIPRTGAFLAAQLDAARVSADAEVLDLGTGSGICAIFAARHARRVVAVDINPAAVRCAGINARLNQLEHRIEVRTGDLFAPVAGDRFDLITFNPPFLCGAPRSDRDRAWRSLDVAERFAAGLRHHLKPEGVALVVLSTFGNAQLFLEQVRHADFAISVLAERRFVNERLAVFKLEPDPRSRA
ncbi:MAG: methyltransferase [Gammaproteobacteria bacterium]|nr:methyltransferase [Gammaproteobacteria bacterium]